MINFHNDSKGDISGYYGLYWFSSFSCFISASRCHFNVPNFYLELKNRSLWKFSIPLLISFLIVMFLTFFCGFSVYLTFGDNVQPNILDGLKNDQTGGIARIMMSIVLIATYPLLFFPIKRSLKTLVFEKNNNKKVKIFLKYPILKHFIFLIVTIIKRI